MPGENEEPRRTIPLKMFLKDYRSLLDDRQLMEKYGLSARNFVNLIKSLVQKNLITANDLAKRREVAVQRDMVKESQFLSSLYICTHCSHPSPAPFKTCPACGMDIDVGSASDGISDEIEAHGTNVHLPPSQALGATESTTAAKNAKDEERPPSEPSQDAQNGSSALGSVRSFFSKLKKK